MLYPQPGPTIQSQSPSRGTDALGTEFFVGRVWLSRALPGIPIVGCGGVCSGDDVVEYLLAGASAVALGTVHFAEPRAGRRILGELTRFLEREGVATVGELIGAAEPW